MRVLLDECIDWRLGRGIRGHDVQTVRQAGWAGMSDQGILERANRLFDVFITVDQNLTFQQRIDRCYLGIIVISSRSNRLADLETLLPDILAALGDVKRGETRVIRGARPV